MNPKRIMNAVVLIALLFWTQGCAKKPTPDRIQRDILSEMSATAARYGAYQQGTVAYGQLTITDTKSSFGEVTYTIDMPYGDKHYRGQITYKRQRGSFVPGKLSLRLE